MNTWLPSGEQAVKTYPGEKKPWQLSGAALQLRNQ
jgi:hypothetical protein